MDCKLLVTVCSTNTKRTVFIRKRENERFIFFKVIMAERFHLSIEYRVHRFYHIDFIYQLGTRMTQTRVLHCILVDTTTSVIFLRFHEFDFELLKF